MRHYFITAMLFLFCIATEKTYSQVKLPRLISDSMVLQRDVRINIWGWAKPGEKVSVSFNDKQYSTLTATDGKWNIVLQAAKAGGPYSMEINASNHLSIKNILMGEVWVCSGQSNMELPIDRVVDRYPGIIASTNNPFIRQFIFPTVYNFKSMQDDFPLGNWQTANPKAIGQFTAVGYFFAKALYEKYKVPIGIIKSPVGGAPAEAWLSEEALRSFPEEMNLAAKLSDDHYVDSIKNNDRIVTNAWYDNAWLQDKGMQEPIKWFDVNYEPTGWSKMQLPGYWNEQGLKNTNGVVWVRKEIDIPESMTHTSARLRFGNVVDRDSVYVNGIFVGTVGYQYPPRKYDIPLGLLKRGKNVITVKVINSSGRGGFYEGKPYYIAAGKDTIDLKGEWQYKLAVALTPLPNGTTFQYLPGGLFNAMISPLLKYNIKGVIWYQGESNTAKPRTYRSLFKAVIDDWRKHWGKDFPFLYVQLANFQAAKNQPSESQWAELREAQLQTLSVPNTAMVVTTDIGEWNELHPLNKKDVGERLALAARHVAYGEKKIVYAGPTYRSMKTNGNKIILTFEHTGSGLMVKGNQLNYFSIAGKDKKFVWAKAVIKGNTVIVWNDGIADPVAVRYAWADNPEGANLYNKEGLPASSFRTDD